MENKIFFLNQEIPEESYSKDVLGGKGYGLVRMVRAGIPVPPAVIIPTSVCRAYMSEPVAVMKSVREEILPQIKEYLQDSEGVVPLVSVRSGAKFSMPGMMDTILFVGIDGAKKGLKSKLGAGCFNDSYERLVEMYGSVVEGIDRSLFEGKNLRQRLKIYEGQTGSAFPDADGQLFGAIEAVFKSWNNERAKTYRRLNRISDDLGTAVVVQMMVFGNLNEQSGSGTLFTRDPSDGTPEIVGEFLVNAPGEDLVSGVRTPDPLSVMVNWNKEVAYELYAMVKNLEKLSKDMQDVEFTIENGKLYLLQTRDGKRTAKAAIRIAVDMVEEGLITKSEMLKRVTFQQFTTAMRPVIDQAWVEKNPASFKGLPASVGVASGVAVFSSKDAVNCKEPCILITRETTPEDIDGMHAAVGILTATGGATSHAAVVARGMDKPCVTGATGLQVGNIEARFVIDDCPVIPVIKAGVKVTINGATGEVWIGKDVPVLDGGKDEYAVRFVNYVAEQYRVYNTIWDVDQIQYGDRFLVATYMLEGGDTVQKLEKLLAALSGKDVVIDMGPAKALPIDILADVFSYEKPDFFEQKAQAILNVSADKKNWKLYNLPGKMDPVTKAALLGLLDVVPKVDALAKLVTVTGICSVDFNALLSEAGEEAVKKLVSLKQNAGEDVRSFNVVQGVSADDLESGAVFSMTSAQLLNSVLAGA